MTGRYIPPALRKKALTTHNEAPEPSLQTYRLSDIRSHFGYSPSSSPDPLKPNQNSTLDDATTTISPSEGEGVGEESKTTETRGHGTLNVSSTDNTKLAYIMLFYKANPFWEPKNEIFVKTNLDLLEDYSSTRVGDDDANKASSQDEGELDTKEKSGRRYETSYPVFSQTHRQGGWRRAKFTFDGFYGIDSVRYFEPESRELAGYLEVKFGDRARDAVKWKETMSRRWAVVSMGKDRARDGEEIGIKVVEKSVNDMLAEMRVGASS